MIKYQTKWHGSSMAQIEAIEVLRETEKQVVLLLGNGKESRENKKSDWQNWFDTWLRRVKDMPEDAPESLKAAHAAVNKIEGVIDGGLLEQAEKKADWAGYIMAQGGVFAGRGAVIKLAVESSGEVGRYGEVKAAVPVGVAVADFVVESVRHVWEVVKGGFKVLGGVVSASWKQAHEFLVSEAVKNVRELRFKLQQANGHLGNIKGMKDTTINKENEHGIQR